MPNPPGAVKPPGGSGGGGIAAAAGGPAAGGCLNGTWTDITFASGSLHACTAGNHHCGLLSSVEDMQGHRR